jgi:hypothetical protein
MNMLWAFRIEGLALRTTEYVGLLSSDQSRTGITCLNGANAVGEDSELGSIPGTAYRIIDVFQLWVIYPLALSIINLKMMP